MKMLAPLMIAAFTLVSGSAAKAAVLFESLPGGVPMDGLYLNGAYTQNFLQKVTLAKRAWIDGFAVPTWSRTYDPFAAPIGTPVNIKIRADSGGAPASANMYTILDAIDEIRPYESINNLILSNFTPIFLSAGTYWFGMTGAYDIDIGWAGYSVEGQVPPVDDGYILAEDTLIAPFERLPFQLLGQYAAVQAVPETEIWVMEIGGIGLIGWLARRRKRYAVRPSLDSFDRC
jgi:hypothetical protein